MSEMNECELEMDQSASVNFEKQMSVPESSISLSWRELTVVAPAPPPSLRQRLFRGASATSLKEDKVILHNGTDRLHLLCTKRATRADRILDLVS